MKYIATILAFALLPWGRIEKINELKQQAEKAYQAEDYTAAIEKYRYLIDSLQVNEGEVLLNLANAYFEQGDMSNAQAYYNRLIQRPPESAALRSLAHQQLGMVAHRQGRFQDAQAQFKESLKADPQNRDSRYNYELISRKLKDKKSPKDDQDKKDSNKQDENKRQDKKDQQGQDKKDQQGQDKKDQQGQDRKDQQGQDKKDQQGQDKKDQQGQDKKDQQGQDKKDQQGRDKKDQQGRDKKDQQGQDDNDRQAAPRNEASTPRRGDKREGIPPEVSQKLKEMKMSEEKAKMILEAMRSREVQYLQQKKRSSSTSRRSGKPDW